MLASNYLKIALRSLRKQSGNSFLNLFGLAVSMAACLLIVLFVHHERSFDAFHTKADRIYRLDEIQSFPGITPQHVALSMYPMGPTMQAEFPEVVEFTRVAGGPGIVSIDGELRMIENAVRVDPAFFKIFDYPVLSGDPASAFEAPNTVALTGQTALSLFGTADAVGREFRVGDQAYRVAAILGTPVGPTHLRFDALFTTKDLDDEENMERWGNNWLVTYLLLADGADPAALEARFPAYKEKYMDAEWSGYYELYLQPLLDVHLGSSHITHDYRNWQKFDRRYVYVFILLAAFVLLIAGINFMNLTTARSATRAKEVGVRKSIGARRLQLALQFLGESMLMAMAALILAVALAWMMLPLVNNLSLRDLHIGTLFMEWPLLTGIFGATLAVGFLAGLYPAALLSAFRPVLVLKGATSASGRKSPFRNALVVSQFAIAIALIVGTLLAMRQLSYMQNRDIGFEKDHVLTVPMSRMANEKYELLKELLSAESTVLGVTASNQRLGNNLHQWGTQTEAQSGEIVRLSISNIVVDYNYLEFYGIELQAGRWFSEERADLGRARVVNEAMAAEMGWTEPLGKLIGFGGDDTLGTVIGVAKDFNFNSLHHTIEPLAMSVQDFGYNEASIRIDPNRVQEAIADVKRVWSEVVTDRPFEYTFLDDHLEELYRADRQVSLVIAGITGLAILIACLGLLGLAAITTEQRTKEIGIRKALGASVSQLIALLSYEFTRLVIVAFVVATPLTYFAMRSWLSNYPYRIEIGAGVFLLAGIATLLIALATVSYRAIKTAHVNPVDTLRYE